jgi:hypothetical protein
MFGQPINWQHVLILARTYIRYAVRGGSGLVFLIIFLIVGLSIAGAIIDPLKKLYEQMEEQQKELPAGAKRLEREDLVKALAQEVRPLIAWWVGSDEEQQPRMGRRGRGQPAPQQQPAELPKDKRDPFLDHLVVSHPPILSVFMLILLAFVPFTVCLGSFNQLSGDIGSKGLRYLLLRTERINIILARFIATILFTTITTLGMMLVVVLYMYIAFRTDSLMTLLTWGLAGWFATLVITLPYICLCTWMSAVFDSPFVTLVLCFLLVGGPVILLKIANWTLPKLLRVDNLDWLERLTPWGWKYELLHPDISQVCLAMLIALGYAVVLFLLAIRHFLKRDL